MLLTVHPSAEDDLDCLYESGDPKQEDIAAAIDVLLEELGDDSSFLSRMHKPYEIWPGEPSAETNRVVRLWREGYNILRLKAWDCGQLIPYRVIYAFDPRKDEFHVLGVLHRDICYEKDHPKSKRILADYNSLGIPTY